MTDVSDRPVANAVAARSSRRTNKWLVLALFTAFSFAPLLADLLTK